MISGLNTHNGELTEVEGSSDEGMSYEGLSSTSELILEDDKGCSSNNGAEAIELYDSGKSLTDFYNLKKMRDQGRISDYVIVPQMSFTGFEGKGSAHLTYDALQLVQMAEKTIKMLGQHGKKVLRKPCLLTAPEALDEFSSEAEDYLKDIFAKMSIADNTQRIRNEKQYTISFNIVGHGSPTGVGMPDPRDQLSAVDLADLFHAAFKSSGLDGHLKVKPFFVEFHCCNTAYVDASSSITSNELKNKVLNDSYIGRFYHRMKALGYLNIQVAGYRGFYATIGGSSAMSSSVQDSYNKPTHVTQASKARYLLTNNTCILPLGDVKSMVFDVQLDVSTSVLKASRL